MYKVDDAGGLELITAANSNTIKTKTRYVVSCAYIYGEDGSPEDISVTVTCPTGEHADITEEEKARFGQVEAWESATLAATAHMQKMHPNANVHMSESRPFGGPSNREEYKAAPEVVTVPAGDIKRRPTRSTPSETEEQETNINLDTPKSKSGEQEAQF